MGHYFSLFIAEVMIFVLIILSLEDYIHEVKRWGRHSMYVWVMSVIYILMIILFILFPYQQDSITYKDVLVSHYKSTSVMDVNGDPVFNSSSYVMNNTYVNVQEVRYVGLFGIFKTKSYYYVIN